MPPRRGWKLRPSLNWDGKVECALSMWADDFEDMPAAAQGCCLIQDGPLLEG